MTSKWNVTRFATVGFLSGAGYTAARLWSLHPASLIFHEPLTAILGGLLGLVVFGAAAISRNHFADSMPKMPD
jgi:uncharacterized membrane protein YphA (DoxX/SURF4 family)